MWTHTRRSYGGHPCHPERSAYGRSMTAPWFAVRPAAPDDRPAIREVVVDAFGADEAVVADLVEALRTFPDTAADAVELVAVADGSVVGHVMLSTSLLDAPRQLVRVPVLSPLAVAPAAQRSGVGGALVAAAIKAAGDRGDPALFLEGDPGYYRRFGFEPAGDHGFRKPSLRIPDRAFQVALLPALQPWMNGTLVYAWPFWALDCVGLRDSGD